MAGRKTPEKQGIPLPPNPDLAALRSLFAVLADDAVGYFNNAYAALVPDAVADALAEAARGRWNDPAGTFQAARARLAGQLEAASDDLILTMGTSDALSRIAAALTLSPGDRVVVSGAEHEANVGIWQGRGTVDAGRVFDDGCVDWDDMVRRIPGARGVAIAQAGNVTGERAPVARIVEAARATGAWVVLDAAQGAPHEGLDLKALGCDYVVFSGHKVWGPTGLGVLWSSPSARARHGAPAVVPYPALEGVVALPVAYAMLQSSRTPALAAHLRRLMLALTEGLGDMAPLRLLGPTDPDRRVPIFGLVGPDAVLARCAAALTDAGFIFRLGRHQSELLHQALGLSQTLRLSAQTYNSLEEVERLVACLRRAVGS